MIDPELVSQVAPMNDPEHAILGALMRAVLRREGLTPSYGLPKGWITLYVWPTDYYRGARAGSYMVAISVSRWIECSCQK